tara:strand:- start:321 stop:497 length:177 start_codon:yes stop_codon:yes gene_type:complete
MSEKRECTQAELKFKELHKELLGLKMYDFANRLSEVFYSNSQERFEAGLETMNRIYQK